MPRIRARLRDLRDRAGRPSYDELLRHAGVLGRALPTSTANDLLTGTGLPRWSTIETFVLACRRHAEAAHVRLPPELTDLDRWRADYPRARTAARSHNPAVPQQLPMAPRLFTDRQAALGRMTSLFDDARVDTVRILAIGGAAGTGKTSLALWWAHQRRADFADGQLYLDLRGFSSVGPPLTPAAAMRCLLRAFDVHPAALSADLEAQVGLYRSIVAGKRLLILLDNARDSADVEPLLPGEGSAFVVVTSRQRLGGLLAHQGAVPIALGPLDHDNSRALLALHLGQQRLDAESTAVDHLLARCAGLPLALTIVAARAARHPDFPLTRLSEEMRTHSSPLDALDAGELTVDLRSVLSSSYHALDNDTATLFSVLGIAPGPDISLPAAAALANLPPRQARTHLDRLDEAYLVDHHVPGRYRMHDLTRIYAAEQAARQLGVDHTDAALRRAVEFYLLTAQLGDELLDPPMQPIPGHRSTPSITPEPLRDAAQALAWFTVEHRCLLAAQQLAAARNWDETVWQLAWSLDSFHNHRGHLRDNVTVWELALNAAERLREPELSALAHRYFGRACARVGRHDDGVRHLTAALSFTEDHDDVAGQAHSHYSLAWAHELREDDARALRHASRALTLFRATGNPVWESRMLTMVGWYHARLGSHREAQVHCEAALRAHRSLGDRQGQIDALDTLGYVAHQMDDDRHAVELFDDAIRVCREIGHSYALADVLNHLGQSRAALGHHRCARDAWEEAADLYMTQLRAKAYATVREQLLELGRKTGPDTDG